MARPLRIEFPGALYHVTSRGNAKQLIFQDDVDRRKFLKILSDVTGSFRWLCHAFCLMENHYHLMIETLEGNLSTGMRQLNGVYTQFFNKRHDRVGHLLQGRYKAILVEKESYLLALCRYIILNPVRAGMVDNPEDWIWSSYRTMVGLDARPSFLTTQWILSHFGEEERVAYDEFKQFILNGIRSESPLKEVKGQILLGSDNFIDKISDLVAGKVFVKEVPRAQRYVTRKKLSELFIGYDKTNKRERDRIIYTAYAGYGYRLNEIADYLGLHYATISRAVKRVEDEKE
jgi:REP element-mobilizing transposase RayT